MDSRLIFESNKTYIGKVKWTKPTSVDSEWIYIGIADDIRKEIIIKTLEECFADGDIYLSNERTSSFKTNVTEFKSRIEEYVGNSDFTLWDLQFKTAIQFNKIGVLRLGKTASQ